MNVKHILCRLVVTLLLVAGAVICVPGILVAKTTAPQRMVYNGHLLDASGNAISTAHSVRFSFWKSADYVTGDVTATGAIHVGAPNYASWQEVHTVTPDSSGYFTVEMGSVTALPDFSSMDAATMLSLFLQVEVKVSTASDTTYEQLDVNASDASVDRAPLRSVPFALNADLLDGHDVGTGSGSIPVLLSGGLLPVSTMPAGTNADMFSLDADGSVTTGVIGVQFGESALKRLTYDNAAQRFNFSDDLRVQGGLTVTGSVVIGHESGVSLSASGTLRTESGVVLNAENAAQDAVLVFGNALGAETLKFLNAEHRFEFSDDLAVTGQLSASGGLSVDGQAYLNNSATVTGDLTVSGLINGIDLASLSSGADNTHLKVSSGAGLTVSVAAGDYRIGGVTTRFTGTSGILLPDDATNYVYLTSTGLTVTQAAFPTDRAVIQLASVVTAGGGVSTITDRRVFNANDSQRTEERIYEPTFEGAAYDGDGSQNVGQLTVNHSGALLKNYYQWTSTRSALQDYDVILKVPLSPDFIGWSATPLTIAYRSSSADSANSKADITVYDTNGDAVTLVGSSTALASTTWTTTALSFAGTPTWTPGGELLLKIKLSAKDAAQMQLGFVKVQQIEKIAE